MKKYFKSFVFLLMLGCFTNAFAQSKNNPVPIIFDSDMGPDYDDVGAITILHALADKGEANILATISSNKYEGAAGVFNVFNTYFKRPDIPVGVPKGDGIALSDWHHWTDTLLAKYPHKIKSNNEAWDAVKLYRKILATQPDHSVTIVTVGYLTNLAFLLMTAPDEYSALAGNELVKRKVKLLVCMAGKFPSGTEFNLKEDVTASQNVFENWPTEIVFSGFEIGEKIKAGLPLVNNDAIKNDPAKDVFRIAMPMAKEDSSGRMSWDETAVLVAVRGYSNWYNLHKGRIIVAADGKNTWDDNGKLQAYLVEKANYKIVENLINVLMMHQPIAKEHD